LDGDKCNPKIVLSPTKSGNEEYGSEKEDNDATLNSKPLNINNNNNNKSNDTLFKRSKNLSRSIPIDINKKKGWRDNKYSTSYIERGNVKMKDSRDSLSSSFPDYVSSSISFSRQIEMMDISSLSRRSKENIINSSLPTNSFFSEKSNQNTLNKSFVSKSSKRPSIFSRTTSYTSNNQDKDQNISITNKKKTNKKMKEKVPSTSDIILCIQMQLCQETLFDYLQDRNKLLNESSELVDDKGYPLIDEEENKHIWNDIIEGVKYIHSKGLIHR